MAHLFSPMKIARTRLSNRIAMAPLPSGCAGADGFVSERLGEYYLQRSRGGVGLIIMEPVAVVQPPPSVARVHIGGYADVFIPSLRWLVQQVHQNQTVMLVTLDAPPEMAYAPVATMRWLSEQFVVAAWRVLAAGFDGVMLTAADGSLLHTLISPLQNTRNDDYGGTMERRLQFARHIIETIRQWMGQRLIIGFRMLADELLPGGITLQDARIIASHVTAAGVHLLDITAGTSGGPAAPVAQFPGWCLPLANSIKRFVPDTPIISSGLLGEPYLADGAIRDGSIDMVMLGHTLRNNPEWPRMARSFLTAQPG
jgi:2,4-dienoyl-CoA reductase-like NADH-dependent reductase (Old Yellow Enzyme family)